MERMGVQFWCLSHSHPFYMGVPPPPFPQGLTSTFTGSTRRGSAAISAARILSTSKACALQKENQNKVTNIMGWCSHFTALQSRNFSCFFGLTYAL